MIGMKVSVSLSSEDVDFLDHYASQEHLTSRSAAVHRAIELLRSAELEGTYAEAWSEWEASSDAELWSSTDADGTADAAR
jgi:Arc/MetJ-type ribon-helix-helix transcriptional regulator